MDSKQYPIMICVIIVSSYAHYLNKERSQFVFVIIIWINQYKRASLSASRAAQASEAACVQ